MTIKKKLILFIQGFIFFNILWYIASVIVDMRVLPRPTDVYMNINKLYGDKLYLHAFFSLYRIFISITIALVLGILIGLLMANSKTWNKILNPLVYFTYPIPKTALLPIIMLLFGLEDKSKIITIVLIIIFQIIIATRDSVLNIPLETYNVMKSLGTSKLKIFVHITLPAILPELFTNLRLSVGTAISVLFFIEGYGTHYGLGYYILDAWTRIDYIGMYAGILVISLLGFMLFVLIDFLEDLICKWK